MSDDETKVFSRVEDDSTGVLPVVSDATTATHPIYVDGDGDGGVGQDTAVFPAVAGGPHPNGRRVALPAERPAASPVADPGDAAAALSAAETQTFQRPEIPDSGVLVFSEFSEQERPAAAKTVAADMHAAAKTEGDIAFTAKAATAVSAAVLLLGGGIVGGAAAGLIRPFALVGTLLVIVAVLAAILAMATVDRSKPRARFHSAGDYQWDVATRMSSNTAQPPEAPDVMQLIKQGDEVFASHQRAERAQRWLALCWAALGAGSFLLTMTLVANIYH